VSGEGIQGQKPHGRCTYAIDDLCVPRRKGGGGEDGGSSPGGLGGSKGSRQLDDVWMVSALTASTPATKGAQPG
jgi:hypothetical protein